MSPPQEQDPAPQPRLDPMPGRVIAGNFRIDGLIGSGAMGNVYKAEQLSLGKQVAIKVLHPHLMGDEKLVGRFKREAKSASLLNHPNSIQIIDSGQDRDGTLYIAMELLTGRDLSQVLRDEFPLPLPRVVRILSQVLSALEEAHAQGVIHRDLKPSNIMLIQRRDEKDFVKVCDFGIAKATLSEADDRAAMLTIQGLVCGTPEYMAPEQARAEPLDGRADLYSAAVILYQMVTGDIPFRADSPMAIVSRHLVETPVAPSKRRPDLRLPKIVDDVVMRGLEKEREMRYPSAVAFREVLEGGLGATSGPATPVPPGVRAARPTVRDISGHDLGQAPTGMVPAQSPAEKFGTTTNMTSRPRGQTPLVVLGIATLAAVSIAGAVYTYRLQTRIRQAEQANINAIEAARAMPLPPVAAKPAPPPEPAPTPPAAPSAAAPAPAATAEPPAAGREPAGHEHGKHRHPPAAAKTLAAAAPVVAPVAAATAPAVAPPPPAPAPPPRGATEVLTEADKLLGQGEVGEACTRGEEAKKMSPRLPGAYKFLGKCYMRAGRAQQANDNYKKYLELAPNAPDAPFVKSMIK
ncbi:MAG TPA: serine/threonine-protein kinase [Polyangia bacterium]|nr:serine/threonine-protein kinase [Polyangia bacterium]